MVFTLTEEILHILSLPLSLQIASQIDKQKFFNRISKGKLTRDENIESHLCVYFAAFDPQQKQVFIGKHRKSDLWLFNGGHIDPQETSVETLKREISEEWGIPVNLKNMLRPSLLTVTDIRENQRQKCKRHYDIWYFINVDKKIFFPMRKKLEAEFSEMKWVSINMAHKLVTDLNTTTVLIKMEQLWK